MREQWQIDQGNACGCKGSDEYCGCQNVNRALPQTRREFSIVIDTEICSGMPCIAGTRIPVRTIARFHIEGYSASEIVKEYPTLSIETVEQVGRVVDTICGAAAEN